MSTPALYRGRFAPSPTGPLHFGSLVTAACIYLDAKYHQGKWLVRIEDLDTPRTIKGAADEILSMLEAYGLQWDENIIYQSQRTAAYEETFHRLYEAGAVYPCACSSKEIADSALHRGNEFVYPGTCRNGVRTSEGWAWRVRTDLDLSSHALAGGNGNSKNENGIVKFDYALQECITQHLEKEVGDFVVLRADRLFAHQLAVVVDDAAQGSLM